MHPKKFDNMMFIDYEQKARYIVEHFDMSESLNDFFRNISNLANKKIEFEAPAKSYINKLIFLKSMDCNVFLSDLKDIGVYKTKFARVTLKKLFSNRIKTFSESLKENHNMEFDDLEVIHKDDSIDFKVNGEAIEFDDFEGYVFCKYYKSLMTNEDFLNVLIDCIGEIIERKDGNINELFNSGV